MTSAATHDDWPEQLRNLYLAEGLWTDQVLGDLAADHARTRPRSLAVVDARHRLDYATLDARASRLAGGLAARTEPGDRVIVQLPNCSELVVALLALWRAGLVPVMALPAHRHADLLSFVEQAEPRGYLSTDRIGDLDQLTMAERLRGQRAELEHWVAPGAGRADRTDLRPGAQATTLEQIADGPRADLPTVTSDQLGLLQLSGGSTGTPKLIPRTHRDYLYSVRASVPICGLTPDSVQLCVLPGTHNFALSSAGILGALIAGSTTVMCPDPSPDTAFGLIEREQVTIAGVVPPLALMWMAAAERSSADLSSLEVLQVGGAKFSLEAARRVEPTLGCRLQQVFGMAEGLVNYTRLDDPAEIVLSTQGRPMSPYDEVRVVDDDDRPVADGEIGHLVTQGPYTIRSYYLATQPKSFTCDGWYRTGDVVVRRPDGYLTVVGRSKEQINRGGEKVPPEEVENHLLAHPAVHEAGVVGERDTLLGERVVAHVVLAEGAAADELAALRTTAALAHLRRHLTERGLATYKLPDRLLLVDELPRTGVGKTSTRHLRDHSDQPAG